MTEFDAAAPQRPTTSPQPPGGEGLHPRPPTRSAAHPARKKRRRARHAHGYSRDHHYVMQWREAGVQGFVASAEPLELEIGAGTGDLLFHRAGRFPERRFIGVENVAHFYDMLRERKERDGPDNVLVLHADGLEVLREGIPEDRLQRITMFFPDPWPKTRHAKRRLVRPNTLPLIFSRLRPGGSLVLRTDDAGLFEWCREALRDLPGSPESRVITEDDEDSEGVTTRFQRKARMANREIREVLWVRPPGACFHPRPEHLAARHARGWLEARIQARRERRP